MFDRRLLGGLRAHAAGRELAAKRAVERAVDDVDERAAALHLEPTGDGGVGGGAHVPLRHHRVDQAQPLRAGRTRVAAGEHHRHRFERIDQARQPHGAAKPGMQAEQHLGKPDRGIVDRDPVVAGERDFEAAAEAIAMDHGDRRHAQTIEPVDHLVGQREPPLDRGRVRHRPEFADIGARDEPALFG